LNQEITLIAFKIATKFASQLWQPCKASGSHVWPNTKVCAVAKASAKEKAEATLAAAKSSHFHSFSALRSLVSQEKARQPGCQTRARRHPLAGQSVA